MGKKGLSPKRQRFADEYLIDLNATAAAIRAGYSAKTATSQGERLLRFVDVAAYVEAKLEKRAAKVGLNQEYVVNNLLEIVERCMQRAAITDAAGEETGVWKFDSKGATGALKLLGEHLGMFSGKVPDNTNAVLAELLRDAIRRSVESRPVPARFTAGQPGSAGIGRLAARLEDSAAYSPN